MSFSLDSLDSMSIQYFRIGDLPGEFLDLAMREFVAYSVALGRVRGGRASSFVVPPDAANPYRLGDSIVRSSRRDRMKIARRFNAGNGAIDPQVPEGRPKRPAGCSTFRSAVPTGLGLPFAAHPALKRWAIIGCPFGTGADSLARAKNSFQQRQRSPRDAGH